MASAGSDGLFPRISARTGQLVDLNVTISRSGVPTTPFALRRIDIYYQAVSDDNLVAQILFSEPDQTGYPSPATITNPGEFSVEFLVPTSFEEGIYFDVWRFIGDEPEDLSDFDFDNEDNWISQCNKFWVFPDKWFLDDGLITPRFGFEPLDNRFTKGAVANLEVALMPLPLYDYDRVRMGPLIPQICPFITIETEEGEVLQGLEKQPCKIGLRQGSYRTNPYVIQCALDTTAFLKGTYTYKIILELPNGEVRVSEPFRFKIL